MHPSLMKKLIAKGAIRQGTEFQAYYRAPYLSGMNNARVLERFVIQSARVSADGKSVSLEAVGGSNPRPMRFDSYEIVTIDGMPPQKFAGIYALSMAGGDVAQGKRRGRPPKKLVAERAAAAALAAEEAARAPALPVAPPVTPPAALEPSCALRVAVLGGEPPPQTRALLSAILAPYAKERGPVQAFKAEHVEWLDTMMMRQPRASLPVPAGKGKPSIEQWLEAGGVIEFASKRDQMVFAVKYADLLDA